ncbi:UDP-3-O-(3-hydroxymyristoyl)glucosamine N-acyltransferase [Chitinolyticbacter meiyuanensis]|uniref:UDP-3-O-(3-hydroxymyristoyl)glucosamine N-acyltransferase n=1 Tax=Chitinolyticbacter meiyuanensis TaxID=682798 RepID=UPI0011E5F4E2|nr:UDP-3-O-(3-hydroxymyristoyl)glucosamine N-acyltransferase [Chitinolyticbacter meiyuanensis]
MRLSELATQLGGELIGTDVEIGRVSSLEQAGADSLSFVAQKRFITAASQSAAAALLARPEAVSQLGKPCIALADPYLAYARAARLLHPLPARVPGIHASAVVSPEARVAATAQLGPGVVIEAGATIGEHCVLQANVFIGRDAEVGEETLIHPHVTVAASCRIGARVILHPGAVIGSDGFGNAWAGDRWEKIPQIGKVIIEDDVEIGANTTVDRGALDDTVIRRGARLDNLIQVAHNVVIGEHTAIAACVGIAGSTRIGARCQIGGAAMISGHLDICDGVTILGGTLVAKTIRQPGAYSGSYPMQGHGDWLKNAAQLRHLDELADRVKQLEKQLAARDVAAGEAE